MRQPQQESLEWKQLKVLFANTYSGVAFGLLYIVLFYLVIPQDSHAHYYSLWALGYAAILIVKLLLVNRFERVKETLENTRRWQLFFDLGQLVTSTCFALLFLFFESSWPVINQILFWILVMSLISGGLVLFSVKYRSYLVFAGPFVISAMIIPFTVDDPTYYVISLMILIYCIGMIKSASIYRKNFRELYFSQINTLEANDKLQRIASKDPLTNLPNRRAYDEYFQTEWDRHKRSASIMSLLIIDVDHFKEFNDHYGHSEGDTALLRIANVIKEKLKRPGDQAYRYGGEEFVVILPDTGYNGAIEVGEKLRDSIEQLNIPHEFSQTAKVITACVGVACVAPTDEDDPKDFFNLADKELYRAKQSGRNRVCINTEINEPKTTEPL